MPKPKGFTQELTGPGTGHKKLAILRPLDGDDVLHELPTPAPVVAAATKRRGKVFPFAVRLAHVYEAQLLSSGRVALKDETGSPVEVEASAFNRSPLNRAFFALVGRVSVPYAEVDWDAFKQLRPGDTLLSRAHTLEMDRELNAPRTLASQQAFVKTAGPGPGGWTVTVGGLCHETDPTDLSGEWTTSEQEELERSSRGEPGFPDYFYLVDWRGKLPPAFSIKSDLRPGNLLVADANLEDTLERGEAAIIERVETEAGGNLILHAHANSGKLRVNETSVRASKVRAYRAEPETSEQETAPEPTPGAPRVPDRLPLIAAIYDTLRVGMRLHGRVSDPALGITRDKEYAIKALVPGSARLDGRPSILVPTDEGDRMFSDEEMGAYFTVNLDDVPEDEGGEEAMPEEPSQPAKRKTAETAVESPVPDTPATTDDQEIVQYQQELVRDRPSTGRVRHVHRKRVLNAMRRLLGEKPQGQYVPGLYALSGPDKDPLATLLKAGWLVRDGSTMLMGIAGTGKTTFITYGTRLMCGAPPRLADDPAKAVHRLRLGGLIRGRDVPATVENFGKLIRQEKEQRGKPWRVPKDARKALVMETIKRAQKNPAPPESDEYWRDGTPEDVVRAWAIHDRLVAELDEEGRERAPGESGVSDEDRAFSRLVFGSSFDYFKHNFIGLAKSDPEKRAEEVLYRTKLLNVSYDVAELRRLGVAIPDTFAPPSGQVQETVVLPEPQAIVTAPVKFVNETNRMSRPVGDAFLGLMAEKEVEFRGEVFWSPDAVWWLDMNPHLGWGVLDWAFLDRIDVSCIIPSAQLNTKLALEDTRHGRRRGLQAATVSDHPEFSLDELQEIWRDVESVDVGDYWPDDQIEDMADLSPDWKPLADEARERGEAHPAYDPIKSLKVGAAILEWFVASPRGYDFSKFVPHPALSANPFAPEEGPGKHWQNLYGLMLKEMGASPGSIGQTSVFAKLERPYGFRAMQSLRKFAKAFAWLNGRKKVTDEDMLEVIPFVLNHRLAPHKDESGIIDFFSTYDWLTRPESQGDQRGVMTHLEALLPIWKRALAILYKIQAIEFALLNDPAIDEKTRARLVKQVDAWVNGDPAKKGVGADPNSLREWAEAAASRDKDYVIGAMFEVAENALAAVQRIELFQAAQEIPRAIARGEYTAAQLDRWEADLQRMRSIGALTIPEEERLRNLIKDARTATRVEVNWVTDSHAEAIPDGKPLARMQPTWDALVASLPPKMALQVNAEYDAWTQRALAATDPAHVGPATVKLAATRVKPKGTLHLALASAHDPETDAPTVIQWVLEFTDPADAKALRQKLDAV